MAADGFINLHEFPDCVRVLLDSEYLGEIKKALRQTYKITDLSRLLNFSRRQVRDYLNGSQLMTVRTLKKVSELLKTQFPKFDFQTIQEHVKGYGLVYRRCYVRDPILPIPEAPYLGAIITHLFCDGWVNEDQARYSNKTAESLEHFKKLLSNFGKVPLKGDGWKGTPCVDFPVVIARILAKKYNIPSFRSCEARIPDVLKNKSRAWLTEMLKTALIDEGAVGDDIYISVKNDGLLNDIKEIAEKAGYTCGKVSPSGSTYRFYIFVENIQQLSKDFSVLPHPVKQRAIKILAQRPRHGGGRKNGIGGSKKYILDALLAGPKTALELSEILGISLGKVRLHLHQLEKVGAAHVVRLIRKKGHPSLWGISDDKVAHTLKLLIEKSNGKSTRWFKSNVYQPLKGDGSWQNY